MTDSELITEQEALVPLRDAWDELAVACAQPMCSPAWMLGWWRHLAPPGSHLRVVATREGERLIGLAPFFVQEKRHGRIDYRLLNWASPRVSPLALPGQEWRVAREIAASLAGAQPRPDLVALEQAPLASHWGPALRDGWPGRIRPIARQYAIQGSPVISLDVDSFEQWLASRSASFRRELRRRQRRFASLGGRVRASTAQTLGADIEAFLRLHAERWQGRGVSGIATNRERWSTLLNEIGAAHVAAGRWRLLLLEVEEQPIAAQLIAAAGGEAVFLNGGWDERYAQLGPSILAKVAAIEDAFARGDRRIDLCPGEQEFKLRVADGNDPVAWTILMAPGRRLPLTWGRSAPMLVGRRMREALKRALPDAQIDRLRDARRRLRRGA